MLNHFLRFVGMALLPCFLLDPSQSAAFQNVLFAQKSSSLNDFSSQALAARPLFKPLPHQSFGALAIRAGILILGSAMAWAQTTPKPPSADSIMMLRLDPDPVKVPPPSLPALGAVRAKIPVIRSEEDVSTAMNAKAPKGSNHTLYRLGERYPIYVLHPKNGMEDYVAIAGQWLEFSDKDYYKNRNRKRNENNDQGTAPDPLNRYLTDKDLKDPKGYFEKMYGWDTVGIIMQLQDLVDATNGLAEMYQRGLITVKSRPTDPSEKFLAELVDGGVLIKLANGKYAAVNGDAVILVATRTGPFFDHEMIHAIYAAIPEFRKQGRIIWGALTEEQRQFFEKKLSNKPAYKRNDDEGFITEFLAYSTQKWGGDALRNPWLVGKTVRGMLGKDFQRINENIAALVERFNPFAPPPALRSAIPAPSSQRSSHVNESA